MRAAVNARRWWLYAVAGLVIVAAGLALGAGRTEDDESIANLLSKAFLTFGVLAVVAFTVIELIARARRRV
jgi:hypothetical protein